MLTKEQGRKLIKLALEAIQAHFSGNELTVADALKSEFSTEQGCFVTLMIDSQLRGCIGYPEPILPLWEAITKAAVSAAFSDPRFPALSKEEFSRVEMEVSVLTVPETIEGPSEELPSKVEIGKHGLIIRSPYGSGLLLPQVFTEYKCTPEQALQITCQKAGLPADAWRDSDNQLYSFEAQIFHEKN